MTVTPSPGRGRGYLGAATLLLAVATGCADKDADDGPGDPSAAAAGTPTATPETTDAQSNDPAPGGDEIQGMFDVGGHSLYLECTGTGSPTVVYMHGSIQDSGFVPHNSANGFASLLAPDFRTCVYDRRNVGESDTVAAVQLPQDALQDMQRLLDAADIAPPYVIVGASFGGMLAYLYANEHPDEVVGMVLLDSMFPDELSLEYLFPPDDRFEAYSDEDEASLERISHFKVITAGQKFIGKEPKIPVIYLASTQEGYEENDFGIPEYDRRILKLQAAYVDRFSPGRRIEVDTPHFMEPVIPDQIAAEVRAVIAAAG